MIGLFEELVGVALGADVDGDGVLAPEDAHRAPADGHCVDLAGVRVGDSDQRPVAPEHLKGVVLKGGGVDFDEVGHGKDLAFSWGMFMAV